MKKIIIVFLICIVLFINLLNTILKYYKLYNFIDKFDNTLLNIYDRDFCDVNFTSDMKIFLVKAYILQNKSFFFNKIHYDIENNEYMLYNDFIEIYNELFYDDNLIHINYYLNNIDFLKMYINYFKIDNIEKVDNVYIITTKYYNDCNNFKVKYYLKYIDNNIYLLKFNIVI